jgi:glucose-6-phosphate isomerase
MESLGKELDLDGKVVHQGLNVFGNKGGTDAHAYIQQLNDGRDDFFVTFIEVLKDTREIAFAESLTMGDYLHAFKDGLANALRRKRRPVIEIVVETLDAFTLGMLIALYERVVAVYAELIHINAFHQPGVQAYKLASKEINDVNLKLQQWLATQQAGWSGSARQAARAIGLPRHEREVAGVLAKFAANARRCGGVAVRREHRDGAWRFTLD